MSEFEKYIEAKYPNRSPKILFQKFKDIDGTLFYGVKEIEDQAEVWQHQQAKIDRLNSVLDERTKEWLQAIECGTYFENVAKPLKAENDELKKRIDDGMGLIKPLYRNEFNQRSNADIHISKFREIEKALRGERD